MNAITFEIIHEGKKPGEYGSKEDPNPYMGLTPEKLERSLQKTIKFLRELV